MKEKIQKITIIIYLGLLIINLVLIPFIKSFYLILSFLIILFLGYLIMHLLNSLLSTYHCVKCNNQFKINVFKEIFSSKNQKGQRYIKCPKCQTKTWLKSE